jgi:hypothetical protein
MQNPVQNAACPAEALVAIGSAEITLRRGRLERTCARARTAWPLPGIMPFEPAHLFEPGLCIFEFRGEIAASITRRSA